MREKFSIRIISTFIAFGFDFIINYLIIINLSVHLIGIIAFTNSLIGFFSLFLDLGFSNIYLQHNNKENFHKYFTIFLQLKAIIIIVNYIPLVFICLFSSFDLVIFEFILLNMISAIISNFSLILLINLESKLKFFKSVLGAFFPNILKNCLFLILIFNLNVLSNPLMYFGSIYIITSSFQICLVLILSKNEFKLIKIEKTLLINFIKETKPLIIVSILTPVMLNIGNILLALSYGQEELAYFYLIDSYIIAILLLISTQVQQLFLAYFPIEFKSNNLTTITDLTYKAEKYSSIFFLSIIILIYLNGKSVFEYFFPQYLESLPYLYILIFIPFIAGINRPYTSHLIPSKRQKLISRYLIIKMGITTILKIIFVPEFFLGFGGLGLAIITLCYWGIDIIFYRYFSFNLGIKPNKRIIFHVISATFALIFTYLITIFLFKLFIQNNLVLILLSSIISISLFLTGLFLCKELNKEDLKFLLSLIKYSRYKESFFKEIKK